MAGKVRGKQIADDTITGANIEETGTISTVNAGDSAVGGSSTGIARRDHQHAVATGTASGLDASSTNTEGASSDLARADHTHQIATGLVGDIADVGTATSAGVSNSFSRADHVHVLGANSVTSGSMSSGAKQSVLESKFEAQWVRVASFSATGSSDTVTAEVTGAASVTTEQNTPAAEGILTTGTTPNDPAGTAVQNYRVQMVYSDDIAETPDKMAIQKFDPIDDGSGNEVYGVLSENAGVWTLNYYNQDGTAYTFGSATNIDFLFAEVFSLFTKPALAPLTDVAFADMAGLDTHNHDDRYYTEAELGAQTDASTGAELIGVYDPDYPNFGTSPNATTDTVEEALQNINAVIGSGVTPTAHAASHIQGGSDEVDGDQVDIDFTPTNYTPDTTPPEVTDVDHLSAHLAGIDNALGSMAGDVERQELVTTQNITGADTALTDTLNFTPQSNAGVSLYLNGVFQVQGAGNDYTIAGSTITWLASSGTAVDMDTTDELVAVYVS